MNKLCVAIGFVAASTISVAQSTIQVDQTGNVNLSTTTPVPSAGSTGTQAPSPLAVQPVPGGDDSSSTGTAGVGSSPSITAGNGGKGTGATTVGGTGGSVTITSGNGGLSGNSATTNASGGDIIFNLGAIGTPGSGGRPGVISIPIGTFANPSLTFAGNPLAGLSFHGSPGYIAYSDAGGAACGGWDDQGFRLSKACAIRFNGTSLGTPFTNGCLETDGSGTGTLTIGATSPCNGNDHNGNLLLTNLSAFGGVNIGGSSPCATFGTAGSICANEGTAPTNVTGYANLYASSTFHEFVGVTNGASSGGIMHRSEPGQINQTGQTSAISTSTLCAASAGACSVAGQYHVFWNFWGSGTACSNPGSGAVTFLLTWTDENGVTHSAVALPMLVQTGASTAGLGVSFPFQTALANESASGDFTFSTNGSVIQYATGYTACTTGTGTYNLRAVITRLQ